MGLGVRVRVRALVEGRRGFEGVLEVEVGNTGAGGIGGGGEEVVAVGGAIKQGSIPAGSSIEERNEHFAS